jgi:hypothetical protein
MNAFLLIFFCEAIMKTRPYITKQHQREMMLELQRKRETTSPHHADPHWMHDFWSKRLLNVLQGDWPPSYINPSSQPLI